MFTYCNTEDADAEDEAHADKAVVLVLEALPERQCTIVQNNSSGVLFLYADTTGLLDVLAVYAAAVRLLDPDDEDYDDDLAALQETRDTDYAAAIQAMPYFYQVAAGASETFGSYLQGALYLAFDVADEGAVVSEFA